MKSQSNPGQCTLSTYYWKQKHVDKQPKVTWKILENNIPDYNPVSDTCILYTKEKFKIIMKPELATVNERCEIFSHYRHTDKYLITNPPDKG